MAGLLTGLSGLGLEHLENREIFQSVEEHTDGQDEMDAPVANELNFIYDKKVTCPVCGKSLTSKTVKGTKIKLRTTEWDLRQIYEGLDVNKYGICQCTFCGYAALQNNFEQITDTQKKVVQTEISKSVLLTPYIDSIYTYEDAIERYKLALACAVVKKAKNSEKANICLKFAWLYRGYSESLLHDKRKEEAAEAKHLEKMYIQNAYKGFVTARSTEDYPMCGMDMSTVDYLIAALAVHMQKYEIAEKLLSGLLVSSETNKRIKEKARELKDIIKANKTGKE